MAALAHPGIVQIYDFGTHEGAPYFALDRIGRAVAAHGGEPADLLAKFFIALPPVSMTGAGRPLLQKPSP